MPQTWQWIILFQRRPEIPFIPTFPGQMAFLFRRYIRGKRVKKTSMDLISLLVKFSTLLYTQSITKTDERWKCMSVTKRFRCPIPIHLSDKSRQHVLGKNKIHSQKWDETGREIDVRWSDQIKCHSKSKRSRVTISQVHNPFKIMSEPFEDILDITYGRAEIGAPFPIDPRSLPRKHILFPSWYGPWRIMRCWGTLSLPDVVDKPRKAKVAELMTFDNSPKLTNVFYNSDHEMRQLFGLPMFMRNWTTLTSAFSSSRNK